MAQELVDCLSVSGAIFAFCWPGDQENFGRLKYAIC